jgi:cyclic pyranopterin phosphate synthase
MTLKKLSHLDASGHARMVDVGSKEISKRTAVASARVRIGAELHRLIAANGVPKGDVLGVARIAGIMAAKKTPELIPLCHPIAIDGVVVDLVLGKGSVKIRAEVTTTSRTGVEMEALTAASVAALALYDMCKSIDRTMVIERVRLEEKHGGASGTFRREERSRGK